MQFRLAESNEVTAVRAFFARNLARDNDAVYTEEFTCPLGVKAAIQRRQMLLAVEGRQIVGAARFYPKKNGEFSLYQFAVDPAFRGHSLARAMFDVIRAGHAMRSLCPAGSMLNRFYERTGWKQEKCDGSLIAWILEPDESYGSCLSPGR